MPLCVKYRQNIRRKKLCITDYFGRQPSYMMLYLPYTCPQLRMCIDHFFVASKVELSIAIYRLGTHYSDGSACGKWHLALYCVGGMDDLLDCCGKLEDRGNSIPVLHPVLHPDFH